HLDKARKYGDKANQHTISAAQHLARAKERCDDGGFEAFRNKYWPDLGKSRVYELLSIGNEKKSIEEVKASTRARVAKHRAKKREKLEPEAQEGLADTAEASVTVTDKSEPPPEPSERQESPLELAPADAPSIVLEQRPDAAPPRRAVTPNDEALFGFTTRGLDLVRRTRGQKVERFAKTGVKADDLAKLGKFLTDLADLKKPDAESVEQSTSCMQ